ncbi:hypothetical protein CDIK_3846, partial [Cucumispora dikerogammari]
QCGDDEGMSALSCSYMLPDSSSNNYNDNLTYFDEARLSIEENPKLNDDQTLPCLLNKKTGTIHKDDTYLSKKKTKSTNNKRKEEFCLGSEFQDNKRSRFDLSNTSQQFLCNQIGKVNKKDSCLNEGNEILGEFASDISDIQTFEQPSSSSSAISHNRQVLTSGMEDKGLRREKSTSRHTNKRPIAHSITSSTENKPYADHYTSKLTKDKDVVTEDYCEKNTWVIYNSLAYSKYIKKKDLIKKRVHSKKNISPYVSFYPTVFFKKKYQIVDTNQLYKIGFSKTHVKTQQAVENPISAEKRKKFEPFVTNLKSAKKNEGYLISCDIVNLPLFFFDSCFKQNDWLQVNLLKKKVHQNTFLFTLNVSATVQGQQGYQLRDLIPHLAVNYTNTQFCGYYRKKIKNWYFKSEDFMEMDTKSTTANDLDYIEIFKNAKSKEKSYFYIFRVLKLINRHSLKQSTDLGNLKDVKEILIKFENHLDKVKELKKENISHTVTEIYNFLCFFKKNELKIDQKIKYSKTDNTIKILYCRLFKIFIPYVESLIDVYNVYLKDENDEILYY